jgi:hypothetical protein
MMDDSDLPDDPTILATHDIWRRIPPWHIVFDPDIAGLRISSAAFRDDRDKSPMSVVLAEVARQLGRDVSSILIGLNGFGVARFTASEARNVGQRIARTPRPEEPAHGSVIGDKKRASKKLAEFAKWVIRNPSQAIRDEIAKRNPEWLEALFRPRRTLRCPPFLLKGADAVQGMEIH